MNHHSWSHLSAHHFQEKMIPSSTGAANLRALIWFWQVGIFWSQAQTAFCGSVWPFDEVPCIQSASYVFLASFGTGGSVWGELCLCGRLGTGACGRLCHRSRTWSVGGCCSRIPFWKSCLASSQMTMQLISELDDSCLHHLRNLICEFFPQSALFWANWRLDSS